jgi:hypothetical protein
MLCWCDPKEWLASPMKAFAYLLLLLLMWAQVDDYWAAAPAFPSSAAPAADDDEYLPAQRRAQEQQPPSRQRAVLDTVTLPQAALSLAPKGVSSERSLTTPFTPPPLYAFMSLQI